MPPRRPFAAVRWAASISIALLLAPWATTRAQTTSEATGEELKDGEPSQDATAEFVPNIRPTLSVPRVEGPVEIDGELDEAAWSQAARATNWSENYPVTKAKPRAETTALIAYDDQNLYLAFICEDDPGSIRASLRDRDQMFSDDFVGIMLDTYADAAWAYEIFVNPLGVQGDLRWSQGSEDDNFDIVFHSEGKITDTGYQVELAIPFSSLRFPDRPSQTWRATFWRTHPRDSRRQYTWAATDRDEPCWPCQWGTLTGIENVRPGSSLDLLPAVTASQSGSLLDRENPASSFHNDDLTGDLSLNARYSLSTTLSSEITVNPDFSQIEADAAQIDVNTTFALFFPEKRPFFQEGGDLFDTFIDAVYTRSINDPTVAGRVTGRANRTSYAYVLARDRNSPVILPFEESSAFVSAGKSVTNIGRLKQTVLEDSYLGALITDRRFDEGGAGTVVGGDGRIRFLKDYRIEFQGLASRTIEPDRPSLTANVDEGTFDGGKHTAAFDGEDFWGTAAYTSLEKSGRYYEFDVDYWHYSPTFRADNGFETQNDHRRVNFWNGFFVRPDKGFFNLILPNMGGGRIWNFDGVRKDEWIRPEIYAEFKAQTSAWIAYMWSEERFQDTEFPGIRRFSGWINSNFSDPLRMGVWFETGDFIARRESPPVLGQGTNFEAWATIKPLQQLVISPTLRWFQLDHPDGSEIFDGYILRTRSQYQFNRELFLRVIVQYNEFSDTIEIDPLLSYKLNPFTVAFLGSTHDYQDLDGSPGFRQVERQLFAKFQYLFQM